MTTHKADTEELLRRAGTGDRSAVGRLLERHRGRLRQMVAVRIDPRLATRIDPSDVVQEALAEASQKLPAYLQDRPMPFYPWLRQIAWQRLVHLHTRHIEAQKRTVTREHRYGLALSDQSAMQLVDLVTASGTSPSERVIRREMRDRVRRALGALGPQDREVLILRHLEQLTIREIAAVLGIGEAAAQSRYRRAVERLHDQLADDATGRPR
jgi:RNA polymerase sigma-70 factor (ECF subfamily)